MPRTVPAELSNPRLTSAGRLPPLHATHHVLRALARASLGAFAARGWNAISLWLIRPVTIGADRPALAVRLQQ